MSHLHGILHDSPERLAQPDQRLHSLVREMNGAMQQILVLITDDDDLGDAFGDMLADMGGFDLMIESSEERAFELARAYPGSIFVFHVTGSRPIGVAFRRARSIDPLLHGIAMGVCADDPDSVPFALEDLPALALPLNEHALRRFVDQLDFAPPISMR